MTPSLLLRNDKIVGPETASTNGDENALPFPLKFEPIVELSTDYRYGVEVLAHLPAHLNSEKYFHQLSIQQRRNLFYRQLATLRCYRLDHYYSLNLPMRAFLDWPLFHLTMVTYPPGLIIEIQDPETFFSLSIDQRATVFKAMRWVESRGIPVWLDDVNEALLIAFIKAKWHLSGVKLDKNAFWILSKTPGKLRRLIQMSQAVADLMIIEGIETEKHKEIALCAGANLGQGYLWPATYPDKT